MQLDYSWWSFDPSVRSSDLIGDVVAVAVVAVVAAAAVVVVVAWMHSAQRPMPRRLSRWRWWLLRSCSRQALL